MLKIALALIGKWRIAVPATGGLAGEQLLEHGKPPKGDGSPAGPENYVASRMPIIAQLARPSPVAQHKTQRNITAIAISLGVRGAVLLPH